MAQVHPTEAAYRRHAARLLRELERIVPGPDAEDAAATTWAIAFRRGIGGQGAWDYVWTVGKRLAWRMARRRQHEPLTALRDVQDPRESLLTREAWVDTMSASATLRDRERRLLGLTAAGYARDEFAGLTRDSARTVDKQIGRARRRLRALVA